MSALGSDTRSSHSARNPFCRPLTWLRRRLPGGHDAGSSLVEFAVVLPMFLLMVTGIVTFGVALNNYLTLTSATGIGARLLAVSRGQTLDPCAVTVNAVTNAAAGLNTSNISYSIVLNGTGYTGTSCLSSSNTTGAAGNMVQGADAKITTTYPCSLVVFGANYLPNCKLMAQTTELIQ